MRVRVDLTEDASRIIEAISAKTDIPKSKIVSLLIQMFGKQFLVLLEGNCAVGHQVVTPNDQVLTMPSTLLVTGNDQALTKQSLREPVMVTTNDQLVTNNNNGHQMVTSNDQTVTISEAEKLFRDLMTS